MYKLLKFVCYLHVTSPFLKDNTLRKAIKYFYKNKNYDSVATQDDGSCFYANPLYDCDGIALCLIDNDKRRCASYSSIIVEKPFSNTLCPLTNTV